MGACDDVVEDAAEDQAFLLFIRDVVAVLVFSAPFREEVARCCS